jgi:DNA-binding protein H-NS
MISNTLLSPSIQLSADAALSSLADLEASLLRVQRQKLQLEQREKALMQALGEASQQRLSGLIEESGMAPNAFSELVRRAVGSSARKTKVDTSKLAQPFVRKASLKFRHPDEPALVWSGRGKTPVWIKELDQAGRLDEARLSQTDDEDDDGWDEGDDEVGR